MASQTEELKFLFNLNISSHMWLVAAVLDHVVLEQCFFNFSVDRNHLMKMQIFGKNLKDKNKCRF